MEDRLVQANELLEHARQLEAEARAIREKAHNMRNDALEEIVPFNVGDIIEYTTLIGWRPKKRVTQRMKVWSLNVSYGKVEVRGLRFNAKLEPTTIRASIRIPSESDEFVKVLKERE